MMNYNNFQNLKINDVLDAVIINISQTGITVLVHQLEEKYSIHISKLSQNNSILTFDKVNKTLKNTISSYQMFDNIKVIVKKDTELKPALGTTLNINKDTDSNFAKENFPNVSLYKLTGITNIFSLLGATVSASLLPGFPGVPPTTNDLVTLDTLRVNSGLGTKLNIDFNENSAYSVTV